MKDSQGSESSVSLKEFLDYRFKELENKVDTLSKLIQNNYATKEVVTSIDGRVRAVEDSQTWVIRSVLGTAFAAAVTIILSLLNAAKGLK